jgi:nicotinamidase-related amidase
MGDRHVEPDFAASALVTIDVQRDTLDGQPLEIPGTTAALPRMQQLAAAFRAARRPVIHIVRLYSSDGSDADLCRRTAIEAGAAILTPGSQGAELAWELAPHGFGGLDCRLLLAGEVQPAGAGEVVIYKPRWGAFFGTPLEAHLLDAGVTTIVFCGANFPNCPRTSIYEASERDFRVVAAIDAISGIYERGVRELEQIGVRTLTSEGIVAAVAALDAAPA